MVYFNQTVKSIFDKHAPHSVKKVRGKPCPWLHNDLVLGGDRLGYEVGVCNDDEPLRARLVHSGRPLQATKIDRGCEPLPCGQNQQRNEKERSRIS